VVVNTTTNNAVLPRLINLLRDVYPGIRGPRYAGGVWLATVNNDDDVLACIWIARDKPFAYIDHLASATNRGHGFRLAACTVMMLREEGFTRILANVDWHNSQMVRAMSLLYGSDLAEHGSYCLVNLARGANNVVSSVGRF
jgi:hypothetical protein